MSDNLPELMIKYPIGTKIRSDEIKETFIVQGYMYANKNWYCMYKYLDSWYTYDEFVEKLRD